MAATAADGVSSGFQVDAGGGCASLFGVDGVLCEAFRNSSP
jgi:hypothetical protein